MGRAKGSSHPGKLDAQASPAGAVEEVQARSVPPGDLVHDGEPEAAALSARARDAVETLKHPAALRGRDARPVGYALRYASPEARRIPTWAVWKDEAFGTTYEPIGFVYNARLLPPSEAPDSHASLVKQLRERPERYRGKIAAYDPERSGIGFLLLTQDARTDPAFADAVRAYGVAGVNLYATTREMMRRVAAGEDLIALDAIGSYALLERRRNPSIRFVTPKDYTLVMSRIALIPRAASHPNAAKVFLDYLLSLRGQQILARAELFAIRPEASGEATAAALARSLGASLRPIPVGPSLLV